jgi:hypothetical protein
MSDGELVTCRREPDHDGVHVGAIPRGEHTDELVQWTHSESYEANAPVDELPIWYSALPLGAIVDVATRDGYTFQNVQLTGAVLDDHEQLAALRLDYVDASDTTRHVLLPWSRCASIEWAGEQ